MCNCESHAPTIKVCVCNDFCSNGMGNRTRSCKGKMALWEGLWEGVRRNLWGESATKQPNDKRQKTHQNKWKNDRKIHTNQLTTSAKRPKRTKDEQNPPKTRKKRPKTQRKDWKTRKDRKPHQKKTEKPTKQDWKPTKTRENHRKSIKNARKTTRGPLLRGPLLRGPQVASQRPSQPLRTSQGCGPYSCCPYTCNINHVCIGAEKQHKLFLESGEPPLTLRQEKQYLYLGPLFPCLEVAKRTK